MLLKLPRVVPTSGGNSHTGVATLAASKFGDFCTSPTPQKKNKTLCPLSTQVFFGGYHGGVKITLKNLFKIFN